MKLFHCLVKSAMSNEKKKSCSLKNMKQNGWQKTDLNTKNLNSHVLYRQ